MDFSNQSRTLLKICRYNKNLKIKLFWVKIRKYRLDPMVNSKLYNILIILL